MRWVAVGSVCATWWVGGIQWFPESAVVGKCSLTLRVMPRHSYPGIPTHIVSAWPNLRHRALCLRNFWHLKLKSWQPVFKKPIFNSIFLKFMRMYSVPLTRSECLTEPSLRAGRLWRLWRGRLMSTLLPTSSSFAFISVPWILVSFSKHYSSSSIKLWINLFKIILIWARRLSTCQMFCKMCKVILIFIILWIPSLMIFQNVGVIVRLKDMCIAANV